jgi:hypothetical protein
MTDKRPQDDDGTVTRTERARRAGAEEKGPWAATAAEGIVPAELGGADAPTGDEIGSTTDPNEPATQDGIDRTAGDNADATRDGGADVPAGVEPDLKDAAAAQLRRGQQSAG